MNIIGHEAERAALCRAEEQGTAAQAYLFVGPRGIGKRLCALEFASRLVGEPEFEPTVDKEHPYDVMILRPLEETKRGVTKTKSIGAAAVREALVFLGSFPAKGQFRVLIIEEAHRLSESAQNALLKTLEEPRSTAVIILVTHEGGALLSTVLSRVKRVRFDFLDEAVLQEAFENRYGATALSAVAPFFFSLGRPGLIVAAVEQPESFVTDRETLGALFRLSTLSLSERLTLAEKMAVQTERTIRLLEWWLPGLYRQSLKITERKGTARYFELLEDIEATVRLLKTTQSNARLLLEKLFLSV